MLTLQADTGHDIRGQFKKAVANIVIKEYGLSKFIHVDHKSLMAGP